MASGRVPWSSRRHWTFVTARGSGPGLSRAAIEILALDHRAPFGLGRIDQSAIPQDAALLTRTRPAASLQAQATPDPDRYIVKLRDERGGKAAVRSAGGDIRLDLPWLEAAAARIPAQAPASPMTAGSN
jgi:hypothetical protein